MTGGRCFFELHAQMKYFIDGKASRNLLEFNFRTFVGLHTWKRLCEENIFGVFEKL